MPIAEGGYWRYDERTAFACPVASATAICAPGADALLAWADPATGLSVAFCHNYTLSQQTCEAHPAHDIDNAVRAVLGV